MTPPGVRRSDSPRISEGLPLLCAWGSGRICANELTRPGSAPTCRNGNDAAGERGRRWNARGVRAVGTHPVAVLGESEQVAQKAEDCSGARAQASPVGSIINHQCAAPSSLPAMRDHESIRLSCSPTT